ncbi:Sphingomyelin phosphodiesterase [Mycena chlorophos]|uniref:Sphingomyelin phosphodiesterase n=1 Tax=Mycena chlorophos TaxID=658473 RepID=A0A8H6THU1_MYCCL|nr:Sphingomyelin phosphodiesterase [Mycena chlorophos]
MKPLSFSLALLPLTAAATLNPDTLIDAFKQAIDCDSCHALLVPLKALANAGDAVFVKTLVSTCQILELEDRDVCSGAINEQGPILAAALRSISPFKSTATKLCEGTFGLCQTPAVNKYTVPLPGARSSDKRAVDWSSAKKPFQVVHFSDVHIDRQYTPGADANCNKPICCRDFSDSKHPPKQPAGPFGNPDCDSPISLAASFLEQISTFNTWSIFTGDVVEAAVWLVNQSEVTTDLELFNKALGLALNAPVFPAIGNHDAAPVNNFPLGSDSAFQSSAQWVFDLEGKEWAHWTNTTAANEVTHFSGSYSTTVPGTNLRIISINTVYWYKQNFWLYDSDTPLADPRDILAFLAKELQSAEVAGNRVWIIGHMPPGCEDALSDQSNYYDQIIQRYHGIIAGQFFGHTHYDQFEIAYSDYTHRTAETAINVAWIAPALTPRSGNPAFKVYDVDPETYDIMDAKVYIADMANPKYQVKRKFNLLLLHENLLRPPLAPNAPLDAQFWHAVTEVFEKNDTAFSRFNEFMTRGAHVQACDAKCKEQTICQMRAARAENNCHVVTPTTTFGDTERDPVGQAQVPMNMVNPTSNSQQGRHALGRAQCEGEGIGHVLRGLPHRISSASVPGLEKMMQKLKMHLKDILPQEIRAVEDL